MKKVVYILAAVQAFVAFGASGLNNNICAGNLGSNCVNEIQCENQKAMGPCAEAPIKLPPMKMPTFAPPSSNMSLNMNLFPNGVFGNDPAGNV